MDLDHAVAAHIQWKTKFRLAITNQEALDAATIAKDNCCELGKWLHAEGKSQYGGKPEFASLLEKHKIFHQEAGIVANIINSKKFTEATRHIEGTSPFAAASMATGIAVNALKKVM